MSDHAIILTRFSQFKNSTLQPTAIGSGRGLRPRLQRFYLAQLVFAGRLAQLRVDSLRDASWFNPAYVL
jgi:hypothetical protein